MELVNLVLLSQKYSTFCLINVENRFLKMLEDYFSLLAPPPGTPFMKRSGVDQGFLSHLGCLGLEAAIF